MSPTTFIDWLTLALVVITAFYAFATFKILRANEAVVSEMRRQQEAAMRPYVSVSTYLRTGTPLFYLRIKNIGKTAASGLMLSLDKDFYQLGEKVEARNLAKHVAFTQLIQSLPPDGELIFLLGNGANLYTDSMKEVSPSVFSVTATYSIDTKVVTEETIIDLSPYIGTDIPHDANFEELKKIRTAIEGLSKSVSKLTTS